VNLLELARADRLGPRPRGHSDPVSQVGRRDPLGAIELPRQPHRAADQIKLEGIAGLHGRDGLLGPVFQFLGVFLGQDGHDGPGGHAVCDGVELGAGLSPLGRGPGALSGIAAVGFDLCCGGHRCKFSSWGRAEREDGENQTTVITESTERDQRRQSEKPGTSGDGSSGEGLQTPPLGRPKVSR